MRLHCLLLAPFLDFLQCGISLHGTDFRSFLPSLFDVIQRSSHNGLLSASSPSHSLLGAELRLAFLILSAPGLSPAQLHRLQPLHEEGRNLVVQENVSFAVLRNEATALPGPNLVLAEGTLLGVDHHSFLIWPQIQAACYHSPSPDYYYPSTSARSHTRFRD